MPCPPPPLWPCNEVLKPHFQSMFSPTINNGCSLLLLILPKLPLLDISCENIFALSIEAALTVCSFSIKKCAKMSVFLRKNRKNSFAAGGVALGGIASKGWGLRPQIPGCAPPLPNPQCTTALFPQSIWTKIPYVALVDIGQ